MLKDHYHILPSEIFRLIKVGKIGECYQLRKREKESKCSERKEKSVSALLLGVEMGGLLQINLLNQVFILP